MAKKAGRIALGLGLIAGTLTGLLFAPEEGKKIRKKIAKGDTKGLLDDLQNMGDEIGHFIGDLATRPSVLEALDVAKDKAADVANIQRKELDKMLKDADKKAETFKKAVAKYVKEQKKLLEENTGKKKKTSKKKSTAKKKAAPKKKTTSKKPTTKKKGTTKKSSAKKKKS